VKILTVNEQGRLRAPTRSTADIARTLAEPEPEIRRRLLARIDDRICGKTAGGFSLLLVNTLFLGGGAEAIARQMLFRMRRAGVPAWLAVRARRAATTA